MCVRGILCDQSNGSTDEITTPSNIRYAVHEFQTFNIQRSNLVGWGIAFMPQREGDISVVSYFPGPHLFHDSVWIRVSD